MSTALPTLTFFGATGDCAGYCLTAALQAGHRCIALARTPTKLTASLQAKGVSQQALSNLEIIQGDARDQIAVTQALQIDGQLVDTIISGVGSTPSLRWSLTSPVAIQDPSLCEDAMHVLIKSIRDLKSAKKPLLLVVSTTGIQPAGKPRDVPSSYVPLYRWLLHGAHKDKAGMEAALRQTIAEPVATRPISGFIAAKPTLLADGPARDMSKVRAGAEDQPALGHIIRRSEVGQWMYENLIKQQAPPDWIGKGISLAA